jgi:hypothetical protein
MPKPDEPVRLIGELARLRAIAAPPPKVKARIRQILKRLNSGSS